MTYVTAVTPLFARFNLVKAYADPSIICLNSLSPSGNSFFNWSPSTSCLLLNRICSSRLYSGSSSSTLTSYPYPSAIVCIIMEVAKLQNQV